MTKTKPPKTLFCKFLAKFGFNLLLILSFPVFSLGQYNVTAPFQNGFIGNVGGNNSATNCLYTNDIGWSGLEFFQNSSVPTFQEQGNDIVGYVRFNDFQGVEHQIPGYVKWRAPNGTTTCMVFAPSNSSVITAATNGSNGSSSYSISNAKYIGLVYNGQTLAIPGNGTVTGNAANNGLLDALNSYLLSLPSITVTNYIVDEGAGNVTITVTLSAASSSAITFSYATSGSTANEGFDYIASSGSKTISAGQTSVTIVVSLVDDNTNELDEQFIVEIFNSPSASIQNAPALITISDNDCADSDADGVCVELDCNDNNAAIYPGATETCNGSDDDCDGSTDEGVLNTYYADADGDGFGSTSTTQACSTPAGYVSNDDDCNDASSTIYPGATETCNGSDDDCDGSTDEGVLNTYYLDSDGDGFGSTSTTQACSTPSGYAGNDDDCNDASSTIYPNATETCNESDDDCDGATDEGVLNTYYLDSDGDGFGSTSTTQACSTPSGYAGNDDDCNDASSTIYPGATETCNESDDDCDGSTDEGVLNTYYLDADGDGFGSTTSTQACSAPTGYVTNNTDCNDANASLHTITTEVCNGLDDDCDEEIDEFVTNTYYVDADGDGFGDSNESTQACSVPNGFVDNADDCDDDLLTFEDADGDGYGTDAMDACGADNELDCDDSNSAINTGALDICGNGIDEDCMGGDSVCIVLGCMDVTACNFNPSANEDDASCTYPLQTYLNCDGSCINDADNDGVCDENETSGCTDPTACNYNANATEDDASCTYPLQSYLNCDGSCINDADNDGVCDENETLGCTDPTACNYDANATDDDASCTYPLQSYLNCDGSCINDADNDGVCDENETSGCTDPEACNYNANATEDDASCTYPLQSYLNCDGSCINDADNDGVCDENETSGCTDPEACNYNANATDDDASCTYPLQSYLNCDGSCINDADNDGVCDENETSGCTDPEACNYNANATDDDASCTYPLQSYLTCDGSCINDADNDGVCDENEVPGCTDELACNYEPTATDDDASCTYPIQSYLNCDGSCINDADNDGVCDENETSGCTDPTACNYNANATEDDASCTYPLQSYLNCDGSCINDADNDGVCDENETSGCTDPEACNYNANATDDDASCTYPLQSYLNCDGSCINDADGDGVCDENETSGCNDPLACNYNPNATENDGTCVYPTLAYLDCQGLCINDDDADGICTEVEGTDDLDGDGTPNHLDTDSDGDGIDDAIESTNDADGDGAPNFLDLDSDNDGIADSNELTADMDGDGTPNYLDLDSDGDNISDSIELEQDVDGDGSPNYLDLDSDGDGIIDSTELNEDFDGDGEPNFLDLDADNDGILDAVELTNDVDGDDAPNYLDLDSDGDNIPDSVELEDDFDGDSQPNYLDLDSDGDGILDETELTSDPDGDDAPNYLDLDSDDDGILDVEEGTDDLDGDGTPNYLDLDSDGDGIIDSNELTADMDEDGIPNYLDLDSDGDNISDSIELEQDVDGDGSPNYLDLDSDGDGIIDSTELNEDFDGDGEPNFLDLDADNDGILDAVELTNDVDGDDAPNYLDLDSDGDNIPDSVELEDDFDGDSQPNYLDLDSDGDGILDETELTSDPDGDDAPNYLDLDSDDDGIIDEEEGAIDTDGDGTPNFLDLDSDDDGILDENEGNVDTDLDGAPDYLDVDSDNDGVNDGDEVLGCTNALACDFNPLATDSGVCSFNAAELLIGQIQNASCSGGLGTVQILNFDQFNSFYFVNEDQEIAAVASVSGLSDGEYMIIGKLTDACVSDTVTFVMGYNNDCSPLAVNDSLFINEDAGTMQLNLVANDTDADDNLDITSVDIDPSLAGIQTTSSGPEGNWSVDANGVLSFTPAMNYFGTTTRLYVVSDASGLLSNTAEIYIEVTPVNDAPIISPASLNVTVDLNSTTTICLDASDVDGDNVAVSSWILMEGLGTINDNITDDYCFDFTAMGWQIPTSIQVVMCDNGTPSLCDTVWVNINVNALSPIAVDDYITSNDGLVNIDVVMNDTLYGESNFTVTIIDSTDFGRVDLDTSLISYQPDWSYCGLDSMTYSVCNSFGMCDTATVYFEVTPVDSDLDGIPDYIETTTSDIDGDGVFNHLDEDSDGDGLTDAEESGMSELCSPTLSDCNQNGIPDYIDFNNCIPDLEIPEGFSPNGDGVNDTWVIPGIENYPGNTMVVFNRWGNQVYSAEPYDNSWGGECNESGTIGGSTLPEGTYFFVFKSERNATAKQGYIYIKR